MNGRRASNEICCIGSPSLNQPRRKSSAVISSVSRNNVMRARTKEKLKFFSGHHRVRVYPVTQIFIGVDFAFVLPNKSRNLTRVRVADPAAELPGSCDHKRQYGIIPIGQIYHPREAERFEFSLSFCRISPPLHWDAGPKSTDPSNNMPGYEALTWTSHEHIVHRLPPQCFKFHLSTASDLTLPFSLY